MISELSCLPQFDSGAYSHLQFLRADSHSVGARRLQDNSPTN